MKRIGYLLLAALLMLSCFAVSACGAEEKAAKEQTFVEQLETEAQPTEAQPAEAQAEQPAEDPTVPEAEDEIIEIEEAFETEGEQEEEDQELALYESLLPRDLEPGMSGTDVTALQSMLFRMGYYTESVNGHFDEATENAVIAFQQDCGDMYADGLVGDHTRQELSKALVELPDQASLLIYDAILETGTSYTAKAYFEDGLEHTVTLSGGEPVVSVNGMTITALASGSAEITAVTDGWERRKFFVSVRDNQEIYLKVGEIKNANNLSTGLSFRVNQLANYNGDPNELVFFAGDCYLDERLFLTDFSKRFGSTNAWSIALSGSTAAQWADSMLPHYYGYYPAGFLITIGMNDLRHGGSVPYTIYELMTLFDLIRLYMPDTPVYWWTIIPHIDLDESYYQIMAVNAAMKEYAKQDDNFFVVDAYSILSDENGVADPALYRDPLHPNSDGYDLLFEATFAAGLELKQKYEPLVRGDLRRRVRANREVGAQKRLPFCNYDEAMNDSQNSAAILTRL